MRTSGITPDDLRAFDPIDYQELLALYQLSPIGPDRDDIHNAMQLAQQANMHRRPNSAPIPVEKFLFNRPKKTGKQKIQHLRQQIKQQIERQKGGSTG